MAETFTYDVFISHSAKDKPAVRELAERLRKDGLRVWLDDWEIKPGDSIPFKIEEGLRQSRTLALVMSAHASASEWVTFERHAVLFRDPTNQQRRFIPVRLDDAEIKDTLRQFAYVDWRQGAEYEYAKLLAMCRPVLQETKRSIKDTDHLSQDKVFSGHTGRVVGLAVSPDGRHLFSGSWDCTVRMWSLDSGRCIATLNGHTSSVSGVSVTPDGKRIVSSSADKTLRVWDIDSGQCLITFEGHAGGVSGVTVSPDGHQIVSSSADKTIRVWDIDSGQCLATLEGHSRFVNGVAVTPDGQQVISCSADRTLRIWEIGSGQYLKTLKGHSNTVNGVALTPDGRRIVSGSSDHTV